MTLQKKSLHDIKLELSQISCAEPTTIETDMNMVTKQLQSYHPIILISVQPFQIQFIPFIRAITGTIYKLNCTSVIINEEFVFKAKNFKAINLV